MTDLLALATLIGGSLVASGAPTIQDPKAEVRVVLRFVDGAGAPVEGVSATLGALPAAATPAPVTSGADGRVDLRCAEADIVTLQSKHTTRAAARWHWVGLSAGEALDLGDVELPVAAALNVHIIDTSGLLLDRDWRVHASDVSQSRGPGRASLHFEAPVDLATGSCQLTGLTPGKVRVGARGPGIAQIDDVEVTVEAGATLDVQLLYKGDDLARVITVEVEPHLVPFHGYGPSPVTLIDAAGQRHALKRATGAEKWFLAALADGEYTLEIDERPFVPWRAEGVRPGQTVRAVLRGDAAVQLEVIGLDGVTAETNYTVFARHLGDSSGRLGRALTPSAPGTFGELPAGTLDLEIRVEGLPMRRVRVADLSPGEVRAVRAQLTTLGTLRGVLRDANGAPVAGQSLEVTRGEVHGHSHRGTNMSAIRTVGGERRLVPIPRVGHVLHTDERGEFTLAELAPDVYALRVPLTVVTMIDHVVEVVAGDGPPVDLTLPPLYDARLHVLVPEGVNTKTLAVSVARVDADDGPLGRYGETKTIALDSKGRCTVPRLIEGEFTLELVPVLTGDLRLAAERPFGPGARIDLGGFALGRYLWLEPGEDPAALEHVFDARSRFPRDSGAPPK
jgi:hypothetical protein